MKKLLLILLCLPMIGFTQSFINSYGEFWEDNYGFASQQTSDGGYILLSLNEDTTTWSDYTELIKTDNSGNIIWEKTFQDIDGSFVVQTNDGGYVITGDSGYAISFLKTDSNGNLVWKKDYLGNIAENWTNEIIQTYDGGYIVTGKSRDLGFGNDLFLFKVDNNGDSLWCKSYFAETEGYSLYETNDNGIVVTGCNTDLNWSFILKTDSYGDTIWSKIINNQNFVAGLSIEESLDSGFILAGTKRNLSTFTRDLFYLKTNNLGDTIWVKSFENNSVMHSINQTTDGGFILVGAKEWDPNTSVPSKLWLIKTNNIGDTLWTQTFNNHTLGTTVCQTTDGGYIISGMNNINGSKNASLIKTDGNGNITSTFNIQTPSSNRKLIKTVDILGKQTKLKTNTPFIEIYDDGTVEKRIVIE